MYYYYKNNEYVGCGNEDVMDGCEARETPPPVAVAAVIEAHVANAEIGEADKVILKQIIDLEAKITPRRIRESLIDATWMKALDAEIAVLRGQLQ